MWVDRIKFAIRNALRQEVSGAVKNKQGNKKLEVFMKNIYEEPQALVLFFGTDIVCADGSTERDPFDDGYEDFGDGN